MKFQKDNKLAKQFQGSKKAAKRRALLESQHLTKTERERLAKMNDPNATMEEMAAAMGIRLK